LAPAGSALAPAGSALAPAGSALAPAGSALAPAGSALVAAGVEGAFLTVLDPSTRDLSVPLGTARGASTPRRSASLWFWGQGETLGRWEGESETEAQNASMPYHQPAASSPLGRLLLATLGHPRNKAQAAAVSDAQLGLPVAVLLFNCFLVLGPVGLGLCQQALRGHKEREDLSWWVKRRQHRCAGHSHSCTHAAPTCQVGVSYLECVAVVELLLQLFLTLWLALLEWGKAWQLEVLQAPGPSWPS
jgi:hypothetical protein